MRKLLACTTLILTVAPAQAWWPQGHSLVATAAVRSLPVAVAPPSPGGLGVDGVPKFFHSGWATIAHCAQDPDVFKNRAAPHLSDREGPDHYMDWELLGGRALPAKRSGYLELCAKEKLDPENIGALPYAVAESTERLMLTFAEHRKWPENKQIQVKCLVYAGLLAHYAGDLQMPLHVTADHDGRARPDGSSPRSGIHTRLDSLIEKLAERKLLSAKTLAKNLKVEPVPGELLAAVIAAMADSRSHVDRAYALEAALPTTKAAEAWTPNPEVTEFGQQRGRASASFIAQLYLTAWRRSAEVKLPEWLVR